MHMMPQHLMLKNHAPSRRVPTTISVSLCVCLHPPYLIEEFLSIELRYKYAWPSEIGIRHVLVH
jgi:hypothetical protein